MELTEEEMYRVFITALLLFPWLLVMHIAVGAFRATRRSANAHKQTYRVTTRS